MKVKVVPNGDEGDTKKETEGATKVGNLQREIKTIILDVGSVQTSTIKSSISDRQIQIHKYTNKQTNKYTNIHIHKYTNIQIHKYQRFHWVDQLLSLNICLHGDCPD